MCEILATSRRGLAGCCAVPDKDSVPPETPGSRIRQLRADAGLSQAAFAEKLGIFRAETISRWEHDRNLPRLQHLRAFAAATESSVSDVSSWLETGTPKLFWGGRRAAARSHGQPPEAAPDAGGTEEVERAVAYWYWRERLSNADRREAFRQFPEIIRRPAPPNRPKVWDPLREPDSRSHGAA